MASPNEGMQQTKQPIPGLLGGPLVSDESYHGRGYAKNGGEARPGSPGHDDDVEALRRECKWALAELMRTPN